MSTLHPDIVEFNRRPLPDLDECMVRPYSVSQGALGLQDRFNTVDTAYASRAGEETADKRNSEKVSLQHNNLVQAPYIGEDARVTQLRKIDQILRQMPANPTPERLPLEVLQFLPRTLRGLKALMRDAELQTQENFQEKMEGKLKEVEGKLKEVEANVKQVEDWSQFRHKVLQFRVQCLEKNLTDEQKGPGSDFQWIMDWERKQNEGM
ncbi:hypothetical protein sscle_11g081620 [Sclerotinia sclerotiorum 1980 UF-70]|uniref:Uncharacterized protein n=1 Tax=Sclerotinia sclerotiorum (strain ATCC 18683 / 1980 / Ss-1) TaxID=665079 RepID=A0A1D9QF29_SCLS1|nr:hypothetical protein sscle_11g081620 [Sclerotinia sclerotiorum 1980 UF-70]